MAKVTTRICDVCSAPAVDRMNFIFDRQSDAAGAMDNQWYGIDLCCVHFNEASRKWGFPSGDRKKFFKDKDMVWRSDLADWFDQLICIWETMTLEERVLSAQIELLGERSE